MKVTVIAEDKTISVDGETFVVDYDYPENLWAIQWHNDTGEAEWTGASNTEITLAAVRPFVDAWQAVKDSQSDSESSEPTYREKRAAEYPPIGDQLDALFHAGVFPDWMAEKLQAVKDKYPKEDQL